MWLASDHQNDGKVVGNTEGWLDGMLVGILLGSFDGILVGMDEGVDMAYLQKLFTSI